MEYAKGPLGRSRVFSRQYSRSGRSRPGLVECADDGCGRAQRSRDGDEGRAGLSLSERFVARGTEGSPGRWGIRVWVRRRERIWVSLPQSTGSETHDAQDTPRLFSLAVATAAKTSSFVLQSPQMEHNSVIGNSQLFNGFGCSGARAGRRRRPEARRPRAAARAPLVRLEYRPAGSRNTPSGSAFGPQIS